MNKNLIKGFGLMLCTAMVIIGCTNEESVKTNSQSQDLILKSGDGISEFRIFLDDKYGSDYKVETTPIVVTEEGETFTAYKVGLTGNKEGYILETPKDGNYFFEHDIDNRTITESHYSATGLENEIIDASGDPYYQYHGFNPVLVHDDPIVQPSKFWGWKLTSYGGCGQCALGPCAGVYVTHYIFGIGGEEQQLQDGDGHNISVPCDPGPPATHDEYLGALKF